MNSNIMEKLPKFLETLGLDEQPMGTFFTNNEPANGYSPEPRVNM